jgi:type VI secretion system protein ImpC
VGPSALLKIEAGFLHRTPYRAPPDDEQERQRNRDLLGEFLRQVLQPGQVVGNDVENNVKRWVAEIDRKLSAQVGQVLHHPDFQRLEGTWRGLHYLVHQPETGGHLKIRVLNCGKRDLFQDLGRAAKLDQSALFKKVYEEPYGTVCGQPLGLLVGDYAFSHDAEDLFLLRQVAGVAAAAHAPFVAAASPALFGMRAFTKVTAPGDPSRIFNRDEYAPWRSFRDSEDARFVGLTVPRVQARPPYGPDSKRVEEFNFEESAHGEPPWMSAAWGWAARVGNAFVTHGWFDIRPVRLGSDAPGAVEASMIGPGRREMELSNLGFLPLSVTRDKPNFLLASSCHRPRRSDQPGLWARLDITLCAARFMHCLMVLAREHLHSPRADRGHWPEACTGVLNRWIRDYTSASQGPPPDPDRVRYPLREAEVSVRQAPGEAPASIEAILGFHEPVPSGVRFLAHVPRLRADPPAVDVAWLRWNDGAVARLVRAIQDSGRFEDLPVLADALEEAGCANGVVLGHCREEFEGHAHRCWVLDLLLAAS